MIDGITTTQSTNEPQYATTKNGELDKDAFLQLMIAQMQNQDPLEPMDGTQYTAQLAQFSSLEQMNNINETLKMSLDANYLLTQSITNTMTAGLIGKEAKLAGDTVAYEGQDQTTIGYDLLAPAQEITIKIYDENGALVKTFENLETEVGQHKLSWDFTDNSGSTVSGGDYRVEIEAKNQSLNDMEVAHYFVGKIEGVRYSQEGTSIVVNDLEYQVSDVFEIVEPDDIVSNEVAENNEEEETSG